MIVEVSGCKAGTETVWTRYVETREERWKRFQGGKLEMNFLKSQIVKQVLDLEFFSSSQNLEYLGFRPPKAGKPLLGRGKSGLSGCDSGPLQLGALRASATVFLQKLIGQQHSVICKHAQTPSLVHVTSNRIRIPNLELFIASPPYVMFPQDLFAASYTSSRPRQGDSIPSILRPLPWPSI